MTSLRCVMKRTLSIILCIHMIFSSVGFTKPITFDEHDAHNLSSSSGQGFSPSEKHRAKKTTKLNLLDLAEPKPFNPHSPLIRVLEHLDDRSLLRAMQTCIELRFAGYTAIINQLNPLMDQGDCENLIFLSYSPSTEYIDLTRNTIDIYLLARTGLSYEQIHQVYPKLGSKIFIPGGWPNTFPPLQGLSDEWLSSRYKEPFLLQVPTDIPWGALFPFLDDSSLGKLMGTSKAMQALVMPYLFKKRWSLVSTFVPEVAFALKTQWDNGLEKRQFLAFSCVTDFYVPLAHGGNPGRLCEHVLQPLGLTIYYTCPYTEKTSTNPFEEEDPFMDLLQVQDNKKHGRCVSFTSVLERLRRAPYLIESNLIAKDWLEQRRNALRYSAFLLHAPECSPCAFEGMRHQQWKEDTAVLEQALYPTPRQLANYVKYKPILYQYESMEYDVNALFQHEREPYFLAAASRSDDHDLESCKKEKYLEHFILDAQLLEAEVAKPTAAQPPPQSVVSNHCPNPCDCCFWILASPVLCTCCCGYISFNTLQTCCRSTRDTSQECYEEDCTRCGEDTCFTLTCPLWSPCVCLSCSAHVFTDTLSEYFERTREWIFCFDE